MSIESSFVAILDAASTTAGTRIYPVQLPKTVTPPAISYQLISDVLQQHRSGNTALDRIRVQVNCWGQTFEQARVLATEIRALNNGGGGEIGKIYVEDGSDDYDPGVELFGRRLDLILWYTRP